VDPFQTQNAIRRVLREAGAAPRKRFGQHFLVDRNLMNKLIASAELAPEDVVLEVGAGTGCLTALLAQRAGQVIAVEIDPVLFGLARQTIAAFSNVTLLRADALAGKSSLARELEEALSAARPRKGGSLKLVANLPYDIATSLVMNLLVGEYGVRRLCFSVQREVAERFLAPPATTAYGPVSIVSQALASVERVARVPPNAFWPAPKVESAMIRLTCDAERRRVLDPAEFALFVRACFRFRRKTVAHILRKQPDVHRRLDALSRLEIDGRSRPEELTVDQWLRLFEHCR